MLEAVVRLKIYLPMELVGLKGFLAADHLRLELVELEDCLAIVTSASLCARYASPWYGSIGRAIVYKVRSGLRCHHQSRRYVHGTHRLATSASVELLYARYAAAAAWLYAWLATSASRRAHRFC